MQELEPKMLGGEGLICEGVVIMGTKIVYIEKHGESNFKHILI